ncbi:MAG TPA: hypothetical protein VGT98_11910 [Candidatus Elarobacter sp.]|nr:hypothetical protein [Candidatus Elarobacter sp.]
MDGGGGRRGQVGSSSPRPERSPAVSRARARAMNHTPLQRNANGGRMKPSFTDQNQKPATDRKFMVSDEHLVEENKDEVAKINQGDELEALNRQQKANKTPPLNKFGDKKNP